MKYLIILIVNLILYLPSLKYGLVSDDSTAMKWTPFNLKRRRILAIALHILVAEYIYYAFPSLFVAALLFSVHPVCVQIPCFLSGMAYGINALIFLVGFSFPLFASPLFLAGFTGIASLVFLPLLYLFTDYPYVTLILPLLILISYKDIIKNVRAKKQGDPIFTIPLPEDFRPQKWTWSNLILVVKTFGFYSLSCLLPMKNGFYNSFLSTLGSSEKENRICYSFNRHFWGGILAIIIMIVLWSLNMRNPMGWGIMIFTLSLIPFLNFITVQQFTAPRYAYLPLVGFQVALIGALYKYLPDPLAQAGILGALFIFYASQTLRVQKHYAKDNITMIILDSQVFPENPRLWYYRYEHMLHKNNPIMAWAEASYGLKYLPEDSQLWFGLACASFELGDMNAAKTFLETSERFMIQADRESMKSCIIELKERINGRLARKFYQGRG